MLLFQWDIYPFFFSHRQELSSLQKFSTSHISQQVQAWLGACLCDPTAFQGCQVQKSLSLWLTKLWLHLNPLAQKEAPSIPLPGHLNARDEALYPQALSHPWFSLSDKDVKLCNEQRCTSSPWSCASLPDRREADGKLQGWAAFPGAFPGRRLLTFLTTAEHCQGQSHDQQCQQTPHVFFGCASLPNLRAFLEVTEVLRSLLSGSSLYPVIAWRDRGSGLCSCVSAPKQSPSFGLGDIRSWQPFWHPSQDSQRFQKILSEVLNGTVEEKQLAKKISFIINMKVIQLLARKPGERRAHPEVQQLFSCDGALSCGKSNETEPNGNTFPPPHLDPFPWR